MKKTVKEKLLHKENCDKIRGFYDYQRVVLVKTNYDAVSGGVDPELVATFDTVEACMQYVRDNKINDYMFL